MKLIREAKEVQPLDIIGDLMETKDIDYMYDTIISMYIEKYEQKLLDLQKVMNKDLDSYIDKVQTLITKFTKTYEKMDEEDDRYDDYSIFGEDIDVNYIVRSTLSDDTDSLTELMLYYSR